MRVDQQVNYELYGAPGWGSTIVEALLTWCGAEFRFEDVSGFDSAGPARERLMALNPLAQVPTLVLPGGEVMTESVAIALLLAEEYPNAGLAPAAGSAARARFLRRLVWLTAAVYPTFSYDDYPERWTVSDQAELQRRVGAHRERLWRLFEAELGTGDWVLGEEFSALDIFVGVMTRWKPRRDWFAVECTGLFAIARRVDGLERLQGVWGRNFKG